MKQVLFAVAFLGAATAPAAAADAVIIDPVISAPVLSSYDWSGFYAGVQVGYGWANVDRLNTGGFANSFDADGFIGGIHVGANYQSGAWVFGVEGDIEYSGIDGNDAGVGGAVDTIEIDWIGSLRGRVGYAWDRLLIYGTGGLAFAGVEADADGLINDSQTHIGWTVGAGAEYAFANNWTTRLEYRYADFGDQDYTLQPVAFDANYDIKVHAVRVGLTYKF